MSTKRYVQEYPQGSKTENPNAHLQQKGYAVKCSYRGILDSMKKLQLHDMNKYQT